jgi:hypothetical protein
MPAIDKKLEVRYIVFTAKKEERSNIMYKNAGKSLKNATIAIVVIGIFLSVILRIVLMATLREAGFIVGLLVAGLGCFLSWLGGLVMYAFGEMADCMLQMKNKLVGEEAPEEDVIAPHYNVVTQQEKKPWVCYSCGTNNVHGAAYCVNCGSNRDWSEEKQGKSS